MAAKKERAISLDQLQTSIAAGAATGSFAVAGLIVGMPGRTGR